MKDRIMTSDTDEMTATYNRKLSRLWDELVPQQGEANTVKGELVRAVGRLNYELLNNGNCNAYEQDDVEGWEDGFTSVLGGHNSSMVTEMYEEFLEYIAIHVPNSAEVVSKVKNVILKGYRTPDDEDIDIYNDLIKTVIGFIESENFVESYDIHP